MKITLEIPDAVLSKAKAKAAERGISLRQFVTEAVADKLSKVTAAEGKPWMKTIGGLSHLHDENVRIQKLIDEVFGFADV